MDVNTIITGECLEVLKTLPDSSINCCITSPPYYGLRDYGTGTWIGGDPNCPHRRMNKNSGNTATGHSQEELFGNVGDAIYKTVCPLCGAIREDKQVGLEETPEDYIARLTDIFMEVHRVLKDDGTLWVNIGDSYAGGAGRWGGLDNISDMQSSSNVGSLSQISHTKKWQHDIIKPKDLIGIPWMLAFSLRNAGWYLRQDIIWQKLNPMPESVKDRCTKAHEYIFMFSKSQKYYFDHKAIQEPCADSNDTYKNTKSGITYNNASKFNIYENSKYESTEQESSVRQGMNKLRGSGEVQLRKNLPDKDTFLAFVRNVDVKDIADCGVVRTTAEHWYRRDVCFSYPTVEDWELCKHLFTKVEGYSDIDAKLTDVTYETDAIGKNSEGFRNKRDVWTVCPSHYKEAHFATFPEELIKPMVLAGCPKDGIVLDPFMGSGTTGVVAKLNDRKYLGIELNPKYTEMANNRLAYALKPFSLFG